MKTISLRALARDPSISEAVLVVHSGRVIGVYTPMAGEQVGGVIRLEGDVSQPDFAKLKQAWMEEQMVAPKVVEPDSVKVQPGGKLSKGLGTIPGQEPPKDITQFRPAFNPAPKPGSKK